MTTTTRTSQEGAAEGGPQAVARDVAGNVMDVANDAVSRIPEAAATTRQTIVEANRALQAGSTERLTAGALLAVGSAFGLLLGGANRFLVLLALVPAAAMALVVLDRKSTVPTRRS